MTAGKTEVAMRGGGYYSLATAGARDVIDAATPIVLDAIDAVETNSGCFTLSDMGCADAGTVSGATDFDSYLQRLSNVYVTASGTSFYFQMLPSGSLDLGFSATAMHWLSQKPGDITQHVHMVGASGAELDVFRQQAAKDWQRILLHRAAELKTGGKLVLVNFGIDEQGRYLGNTGGVNMFDRFNEIWQGMIDDGTVTADEYSRMTLPQYYNTVEEFSAPLLDRESDVYKAGLRLDSIKTAVMPCPYAADFKRHANAADFAKAYIPTLRSWNESTYFAGLSSERPLQQRQEIIEQFYGTYEQQVAENPEGHAMDYVHAYMVISKV